jgi:fido (protein-threonine AMPylation protein)
MTPNERLAHALEEARHVAQDHGVRGKDLKARTRKLLLETGALIEVIRGWYLLAPPHTTAGDTTLWHGNIWTFLGIYLADRVGDGYCLSAESSLDLLAGETRTPQQVVVILQEGGNNVVELAFGTSLLTYRDPVRLPRVRTKHRGVNIMTAGTALARVSPSYFEKSRMNAELVLRSASDQDLVQGVLEYGKAIAAGRVLGALIEIGETGKAERLRAALTSARLSVKPENPFPPGEAMVLPQVKIRSPYAGRILALWNAMREAVIANFPPPPATLASKGAILAQANNVYRHDAYNSLSIEGYFVTADLVERVRSGTFNMENADDRRSMDAMAAKGYYLAHEAVLKSIDRILDGANPGKIADQDLPSWHVRLYQPAVDAGIIPAYSLAGYRERAVFIRNSMHVPPPPGEAVMDAMDALFASLQDEPNPAVRGILGHFLFVFIHPFQDGNGRIGRFLMNAMLASGGYPWTIIRVSQRPAYMAALEAASTQQEILPFVQMVAGEMSVDWSREGMD